MKRQLSARCSVAILAEIVALASAGQGCRCDQQKPSRLSIGTVQVVDRTPPGYRLPGAGADQVRGWVRERVRAAKGLELRDSSSTSHGAKEYRLRLEFAAGMSGDPPRYTAIVHARAAVPGRLEGLALKSSLIAPIGSAKGKPTASKRRAHLRRSVERAVADIAEQATLALGSDAQLRAALRAKEPHQVLAAVDIAAVQHRKRLVPALIGLLRRDDQRIVDRTVGALASLGDRRAVRPLTRLAKMRDTGRLAKVIDAIAALGGKEASDYLSFIAGGHPDGDIRNLAKEALERMERRR